MNTITGNVTADGVHILIDSTFADLWLKSKLNDLIGKEVKVTVEVIECL